MGYAKEKQPESSYRTFQQLYELYKTTRAELEFYGRHVPGADDLIDRKYERQESLLMQIQDELLTYASIRPVQTLEDAEALSALWRQLIVSATDECSRVSDSIASNLMSFYQSAIRSREEVKRVGSAPALA